MKKLKSHILLFAFLFVIGTISSFAVSGFCPLVMLQNLAARLPNFQVAMEQKFTALIQNNLSHIQANTKRLSWVAITDAERKTMQAMADARKAIAKANDATGDTLDQAAVEALLNTLSRERCVLAQTELEIAGSGFGKHAHLRGNANSVLLHANQKNTVDFIHDNRGFAYTEIEIGRDLDEVLDMNIVGVNNLLHDLEQVANWGFASELHSIRSLKRRNPPELVTEIEPAYPGTVGQTKPVDFKTNNYVYQNKADTGTFKAAYNTSSKIDTAAKNIIAVEAVAGHGKYRWSGSNLDPSQLSIEISAINARLQALGSQRVISPADIVSLPWD